MWALSGCLIISWVGIIFGILLLLGLKQQAEDAEVQKNDPWYDYGYHCQICGYQWMDEGAPRPFDGDPNLRLMGENLLREEEEERERQRRLLD